MFNDSSGNKLTLEKVAQELVNFMRQDESKKYKIIIGTDSQYLEDKTADFVNAVVIHRVGNGGRYFWKRYHLGKFYNIRDRIIQEALASIEIAHEFLNYLKKYDTPAFAFEIHVDVGENGATRSIINEIVGIVRANNFEVKTKPYSYAASKVADRHV